MKIQIVFSANDMRTIKNAARQVRRLLPVVVVRPKPTIGSLYAYADEDGFVRFRSETPVANAR